MNLIKLGAAYFNMDLVTDVWVNRGHVTVFFAAPAMYSAAPFHGVTNAVTTREVSFHGAQAVALIRWLEKRAEDITPELDEAANVEAPGEADDPVLADNGTIDDGPSS